MKSIMKYTNKCPLMTRKKVINTITNRLHRVPKRTISLLADDIIKLSKEKKSKKEIREIRLKYFSQYTKNRMRNDPAYRKRQLENAKKWQKLNPERWKIMKCVAYLNRLSKEKQNAYRGKITLRHPVLRFKLIKKDGKYKYNANRGQ